MTEQDRPTAIIDLDRYRRGEPVTLADARPAGDAAPASTLELAQARLCWQAAQILREVLRSLAARDAAETQHPA